MPLWSRIRTWFGSESAQTRPIGGVPDPEAPDTHSTTGTTPSGTFVGRASGDDQGEVDGPAQQRADEPPRPEGEPRRRAPTRARPLARLAGHKVTAPRAVAPDSAPSRHPIREQDIAYIEDERATIEAPTLVVWSGQDQWIDVAISTDIEQPIPGAQQGVVPTPGSSAGRQPRRSHTTHRHPSPRVLDRPWTPSLVRVASAPKGTSFERASPMRFQPYRPAYRDWLTFPSCGRALPSSWLPTRV